jgi:hypothetical protein
MPASRRNTLPNLPEHIRIDSAKRVDFSLRIFRTLPIASHYQIQTRVSLVLRRKDIKRSKLMAGSEV